MTQSVSSLTATPGSSPSETSNQSRAFMVFSTHWDREWYEAFQHYRYRLVRVLDRVLEALEHKTPITHFQLDGQSIPIEDYLEIRPERREQIKKLATEGRLSIGPWYVLPDEFLPSGESLIRNLQEGRRVASEFAEPSQAGFMCDIFGHNSQLPQILKGFGIDVAYVWRGVNEADVGSHFRWQSPDGSEVIAHRFGPSWGYCDYAFLVRSVTDAYVPQTQGTRLEKLQRYIQTQKARNSENLPILIFDGADHLEIDEHAAAMIEEYRANRSEDGPELVCGTLDDYSQELLRQVKNIRKCRIGELRDPGAENNVTLDSQWLIAGVLSSRVRSKQANAHIETLLTRWAEPFSCFAAKMGAEFPSGFTGAAWRHLISNHAHDSICGCSIDQVHKDMEYRFDQARLIGERLKDEALISCAKHIQWKLSENPVSGAFGIVLFNPGQRPLDEVCEFTIRLPKENPAFQEYFGYESKPVFELRDPAGNIIPYQRLLQQLDRTGFTRAEGRMPDRTLHHEVNIAARVKIPAFGYTTLTVRPVTHPVRHSQQGLVSGPGRAENEYLKLEIGANGLLTVEDRRTGQVYPQLLLLEDGAEIGDGWNHCAPVNNEIHYSHGVQANIACIADGPCLARFLVRIEWALPKQFNTQEQVRDKNLEFLTIEHTITLRAGLARVEIKTTVYNRQNDHRLRLMLPTHAVGDSYLADSPFDVVERAIGIPDTTLGWRELMTETNPQHSWTLMRDDTRGLAVIAPGLYESAVRATNDRPITLTLFRAFGRTVFTDGEPGGQNHGTTEFNYWVIPVDDETNPAQLFRLAGQLAAGTGLTKLATQELRQGQTEDNSNGNHRSSQDLPSHMSFITFEGDAVVTAFKPGPAGDWLLRCFNPLTKAVDCELRMPGLGLTRAWRSKLSEERMEELSVDQGALKFSIGPKKIETLRLC